MNVAYDSAECDIIIQAKTPHSLSKQELVSEREKEKENRVTRIMF